MRYQFVYNAKESRYSKMESYYIYDTKDKKYIFDMYNNIGCISLDRDNRRIYFYGMHVAEHWILENFYLEIIQEFLELAEGFNIVGYTIDEDCVGGKIYYKYEESK